MARTGAMRWVPRAASMAMTSTRSFISLTKTRRRMRTGRASGYLPRVNGSSRRGAGSAVSSTLGAMISRRGTKDARFGNPSGYFARKGQGASSGCAFTAGRWNRPVGSKARSRKIRLCEAAGLVLKRCQVVSLNCRSSREFESSALFQSASLCVAATFAVANSEASRARSSQLWIEEPDSNERRDCDE